ncbi:MAG: 3-phosphoshikimate 1-carboxyvinyltransferase [Acidimicrobiales bacterium]|nr:3-phosphoshikimate 1-carboxyvinyltransferase [Acidimicrobiales bacterium]
MKSEIIEPTGCLTGGIEVPGDKSISHRVLMLASLADGESRIHGLSKGQDVKHTMEILSSLGVQLDEIESDVLHIQGGALKEPSERLYVGNSGTSIRLMSGILAGLPFSATLDGDGSIRKRPMERIIEPLERMGATISCLDTPGVAPFRIDGGGLKGIEYQMEVPSAQVKGCLMFAGLFATGDTTVIEITPTRAHTEELFEEVGLDVDATSTSVTVKPGQPKPFIHKVKGDPSQAAFWVVGATILKGSEVSIKNVYTGHARDGFIDVLLRMGADIIRDPVTNDLNVASSELVGTVVEEAEIPGLIDEVPILAVAAACADGETYFKGLGELRFKESNRLETIVSEIGSMGMKAEISGDDLVIQGGKLTGGQVDSHGDHRIAMSCAIAALVSTNPTEISGWEAVSTSYPDFIADLDALRK